MGQLLRRARGKQVQIRLNMDADLVCGLVLQVAHVTPIPCIGGSGDAVAGVVPRTVPREGLPCAAAVCDCERSCGAR